MLQRQDTSMMEGLATIQPNYQKANANNNNSSNQGLQHEGNLFKRQIELKHGKSSKITNYTHLTNKMSIYRYNANLKGLWCLFRDSFIYWENIFTVIFAILIYFAREQIQMTYFYPIIILIVNISIALIVNLVVDFKLKNACNRINKKEVLKYIFAKKQQKHFQPRSWDSLVPGDIIKVYENQEIPADVLILDSQSNIEHRYYVRGGINEDINIPTLKRSCEGTQNKTGMKISTSQFVEQISGLVKFEYNFNGFFNGTFKLSNNPAAFNINIENVATRGSYLCQTKSVICLVLNVGYSCMSASFQAVRNQNANGTLSINLKSKKAFDKIYQPMRLMQGILIFLFVLISFIIVFQATVQKNLISSKFINAFINKENQSQNDGVLAFIQGVLAFVCGLFFSLPLSYKQMMDLVTYVNTNFAEWDYNLFPATVKFNEPSVAKTLGTIHSIFLSKQAIMSHNVKKVKIIKLRGYRYIDEDHHDKVQEEEKVLMPRQSVNLRFSGFQQKANGSDQDYQMSDTASQNNLNKDKDADTEFIEGIDTYLPNIVNFQNSFNNSAFNRDIYSNNESIYADEQAQLMLADTYGYQFLSRKNKHITISLQDQNERLDVLVLYQYHIQDQMITSIVVKPFQSTDQGATLYVKGAVTALYEFLNDESVENFQFAKDSRRFAKMGLHSTLFAKKELSQEEVMELEMKINEAMSLVKDQEEKIVATLHQYAQDLDALGVLGIQEIFNARNSLVIDDCLKNGVKIWMLQKDDEPTTIINCNAMKLLQSQQDPLVINGETEKDVEDQVKACLKNICGTQQAAMLQKKKSTLLRKNLSSKFIDEMISDESPETNKSKRQNGSEESKESNRRIMIFNGNSLKFINRDDQLLAYFLTLAQMSDFIIGCSITPLQKAEIIKQVKNFNHNTNNYVMSIVACAEDVNMITEADVSIGISTRYKQTDSLLITDIVMQDFYPITYLLFKHGTYIHRRLRATTQPFIYRTFIIAMIQIVYMITNGFSAVFPVKQIIYLSYLLIVSPIQIFIFGIGFKEVGYDQLHRVYGEYKRNFTTNVFDRYDVLYNCAAAVIDSAFFYLIVWQLEYPVCINGGRSFDIDGFQIYFALLLFLILTFELTNYNQVIKSYLVIFIVLNIIGIIFILDDENLIGIRQTVNCPQVLFYFAFNYIFQLARNYFFDVCRKIVFPSSKRQFDFYQDIEDRLYFEEFEDPNQEFYLENLPQDFTIIQKKLNQKRMMTINENMVKIQRSDSMDQLVQKLNELNTGNGARTYDSSMMNWMTLRFNDANKEMEYRQSRQNERIMFFKKITYVTIAYSVVSMIKEGILSGVSGIPIYSLYFYMGFLIICLIRLILLYYMQKNRITIHNLILLSIVCVFYSFCYFYIEMLEFSLFMSVVVYVMMMRGTYVLMIMLLVYSFYVLQMNLVQLNFASEKEKNGDTLRTQMIDEQHSKVILAAVAIIWIYFVTVWSLYIYWEEKARKIDFQIGYKKIKEFQKLKSILHVLMPDFVRERIRQGQRYIADEQGEVTIIFCDISEFDGIVQMFTGKELIQWLDKIYNALDQMCEQHGLQKVETVGKTYMACGGLKVVEKNIDLKLLSKHHSIRVTDFAFSIMGFIQNQQLKDGSPIKMKIGIHSGEVISGVVGENKPQFSLIGDAVNKTSRVCSKCDACKILVSKETHRHLETFSNNFSFDSKVVEMKGIGREYVYTVHRRRDGQKMANKIMRRALIGIKDKVQSPTPQAKSVSEFGETPYSHNMASDIYGGGDSQRSMIMSDDKVSRYSDQQQVVDSDESGALDEMDVFHEQTNLLSFGELKDDRQIVKNPVENSQYNLVERPTYLLVFKQQHLEQMFYYNMMKTEAYKVLAFLISFVIFNKLMVVFYIFESQHVNARDISLYVIVPIVTIYEIYLIIRVKLNNHNHAIQTTYLLTVYFSVILILITLQIHNQSSQGRLFEIYLMESMVALSVQVFLGVIQLRFAILIYAVYLITWITVCSIQHDLITNKIYAYAFENIFFIMMHHLKAYVREMNKRKTYNKERVIEVEIKRTNELLSNLLPPPVLEGIMNDQKVVDELDDVTILFTDMVGFTQFSNNVKNPKEVVKLLSDLFTRFDQLCVANKVYKVHTIGDCYVILGYTGHIPVIERTPEIKAQEAYKVIQTAFEMIEIINEVRENSSNPDLKDLNMRIGIHTGKIVAGIIGSKIVRYDIFGENVLIANKMESHGLPGQVVVSEYTKAILLSNTKTSEKLEFLQHEIVLLELIQREVESFIVNARESTIGSHSSIRGNDDNDFSSSSSFESDDEGEDLEKEEENKTEQAFKNVDQNFKEGLMKMERGKSNSHTNVDDQ